MAPLPEAAPFFRTLLSLTGFAGRSRQHRHPAGASRSHATMPRV